MLHYLKLDEAQIQQVKSAIEQFYLEKYGEVPASLTHAVALEAVASQMREKCAAEEIEKAKMLCSQTV
jgi:hypothetical protein